MRCDVNCVKSFFFIYSYIAVGRSNIKQSKEKSNTLIAVQMRRTERESDATRWKMKSAHVTERSLSTNDAALNVSVAISFRR